MEDVRKTLIIIVDAAQKQDKRAICIWETFKSNPTVRYLANVSLRNSKDQIYIIFLLFIIVQHITSKTSNKDIICVQIFQMSTNLYITLEDINMIRKILFYSYINETKNNQRVYTKTNLRLQKDLKKKHLIISSRMSDETYFPICQNSIVLLSFNRG